MMIGIIPPLFYKAVLAVWILLLCSPLIAYAACTDLPQAGVDWQRCRFAQERLTNIDVSGGNLRDISFARADISHSVFDDANIFRGKFTHAVMREASFQRARLTSADFVQADAREVRFQDADLRNVNFFRAQLQQADFSGAQTMGANFAMADVSGARWVDGVTICRAGSVGRCLPPLAETPTD